MPQTTKWGVVIRDASTDTRLTGLTVELRDATGAVTYYTLTEDGDRDGYYYADATHGEYYMYIGGIAQAHANPMWVGTADESDHSFEGQYYIVEDFAIGSGDSTTQTFSGLTAIAGTSIPTTFTNPVVGVTRNYQDSGAHITAVSATDFTIAKDNTSAGSVRVDLLIIEGTI